MFVGDDAFQLNENFMKPYSHHTLDEEKRIFNYRLSRARRIVENVFGILSVKFGIFQKPINLAPEKVKTIILACVYLHNFLMRTQRSHLIETTQNATKTNTISSGPSFERLQSNVNHRSALSAEIVRQKFVNYFNNEGSVPWQHAIIN